MEVLAAVTARLEALGYKVTEADYAALRYQIAKAETDLKVRTNRLRGAGRACFTVWADMAAGLFLTEKKGLRRASRYFMTLMRRQKAYPRAIRPLHLRISDSGYLGRAVRRHA